MIGIILASIAVLVLAASGIYAMVKQRTAVNAILLITVLLLAGIAMFDQLSLQSSVNFETFKQISLYLEALLPGSDPFSGLYAMAAADRLTRCRRYGSDSWPPWSCFRWQ